MRFRIIVGALLTTAYFLAIFAGGMWVRDWVWQECDAIHFRGDINRARQHGDKIVAAASAASNLPKGSTPTWSAVFDSYLGNYDQLIEDRPDGKYDLDYPPIRLLIMTLWSRLIYNAGPIEDISATDLCQPLLNLNTCAELLAAIAAFLLVRHWVGIDGSRRRPWLYGLLAGTLIWLDPSILLDAHGWPQWDAWVLPFFLFAAWAASTDRWLAAGVIVGIGGGFKGQLWTVAPVLVLWPLFSGRWKALLNIVIGWAAGIACIHAIWVLSIPYAREWLATLLLVSIALRLMNRLHYQNRFKISAAVIAAIIMLWPWIIFPETQTVIFAIVLLLALTCAICLWAGTNGLPVISALVASAIFLAGQKFGASFGWFKIGILFGARRHQQYMFAGIVNNLPAILQMRFGWTDTAMHWMTIPLSGRDYEITIGQLLIALYVLGLVMSAVGLALSARRGSRFTLIALIVPWILLYTIMPQMRERYLLWGGAMSAIWIGVGVGPTLLHFLITLLSAETILQVMLGSQRTPVWPEMDHIFRQMHPDIGWAVILCAAVSLYIAFAAIKSVLPHPVTPTRMNL